MAAITTAQSGLWSDVATGYTTYTGQINLTSNQSVPVAMTLASSTQLVDSNLIEFSQLMGDDTAFQRVIAEASGISTLKDKAKLLATWKWPTDDYKTAWNSCLAHASVTDPSAGEISAWIGYLTSSEYAGVSFNASTGVVS